MGFEPTSTNIKSWCEANDVEHLTGAEGQLVITRIFSRDIPIRVVHHTKRKMLTFAVRMPFKVPMERLEQVGLAVNLVNGATFMGCWTIQRSMELFYRLTIPSVMLIDEESVKFILGAVLGSVDASASSLKSVVDGAEPRTVIP